MTQRGIKLMMINVRIDIYSEFVVDKEEWDRNELMSGILHTGKSVYVKIETY